MTGGSFPRTAPETTDPCLQSYSCQHHRDRVRSGAFLHGIGMEAQVPTASSDSRPLSPERSRSASDASTLVIHGSVNEVGRDMINVASGAQASFTSYYLSPGPTAIRDPECRNMFQDNLGKRTLGTGRGFTTSEMFRLWLQKRYRVLWAYGMQYFSRSWQDYSVVRILAKSTTHRSIAIEYLQEKFLEDQLFQDSFGDVSSSDICVCFAYCRYAEQTSARDILAAMVRQAVERHPQLRPIIQRLYSRHYLELTKPSYDELAAAFAETVKAFKTAFCILDGFDETLDHVKSQLMAILSSIDVQLLVTSRPSKYFEMQIPHGNRYEVYAQDQDIDCLILSKIDESPTLKALLESNASLQGEIFRIVQNKAAGMFLHASLQLNRLQRCETVGDLRDEISKVPPDIKGLYTDTWNRIVQAPAPNANRGTVILLWMVFAARPLSVDELQFAVMLDEGFPVDKERIIPYDSLVSLCHGLIAIEKKSRTVRLIHSTAGDALKPLILNTVPDPHGYLAALCIRRLKSCGCVKAEDEGRLFAVFRQNKLSEYAYDWWAYHVRRSTSVEIERAALDFLVSLTAFPIKVSRYLYFCNDFSSIHLAAWYNLPRQASSLMKRGYKAGKPSHSSQWTALMAASYRGHISVATELIRPSGAHGQQAANTWENIKNRIKGLFRIFDPCTNAVDVRGRSALILAAMMGHAAIVQMLLGAGARVNTADDQGYTALMAAAMRGHLQKGINCAAPGHGQPAR
ncbi:hypothetical protein BKA70DRAFT_1229076 [Coprinopsis sp. MPI-PUGE-AT-0042]|nr:hypothetical protein BKA70DRAFT_1229076 [Coprinopsis sp. MPI-PUGE-AT-0042]